MLNMGNKKDKTEIFFKETVKQITESISFFFDFCFHVLR